MSKKSSGTPAFCQMSAEGNDLNDEISAACEHGESIEQIIERMGDPDAAAAELFENYTGLPVRPFEEYKSRKTLFGLPFVHIIRPNKMPSAANIRAYGAGTMNTGGRFSRKSVSGQIRCRKQSSRNFHICNFRFVCTD